MNHLSAQKQRFEKTAQRDLHLVFADNSFVACSFALSVIPAGMVEFRM